MPYVVKKNGDQYCVYKKDAKKPIKGGCHDSKSDADKHRDALNINVKGSREVTYKPIDGTDGLLSMVYNVEVCAVGIEYPLATGPATFTQKDLLEAVASQDDPNVVPPRVWLGHPDDDRFHAGRATPAGSAEPAIGKIVNMRVEDEGLTLVGDIAGMPTWLAKILASAYPSRSIEGFQEATTASGQTWGLVVTDLALLGVTWPGVSSLEDLQALYSEDGPEGVEVKEDEMTVAAARNIAGQVDVDDVRRAFGKAFEAGEFEELQWPWIRAMLQDPFELIVDDDATGEIWSMSYSIDGDDVSFGDPVKKKIQYVNASQKKDRDLKTVVVEHLLLQGRQVAARYTSPDDSRQGMNQEDTMDPAQLRASLGLPADATDTQVTSRIQELRAATEVPSPDQLPAKPEESFKGPGSPPDGPVVTEPPTQADPNERDVGERGPDGTPDTKDKDPNELNAAMAALRAAGMVAVPGASWQAMQGQVATLHQKSETDDKAIRAQAVATALRKGKIFPSQREFYASKVEDPKTRDAFMHLLTASVADGGLMEDLVPIHSRSVDNAGPDGTQLTAEAYPPGWLPELQQPASHDRITQEVVK